MIKDAILIKHNKTNHAFYGEGDFKAQKNMQKRTGYNRFQK